MSKGKAYCDQTETEITISEARDFYFAQPLPRRRLTFKCGDARCRAISRAAIIGANYDKPDDPFNKIVSPYFRENPHHPHIANCTWISENGRDSKTAEHHNTRTSAATAERGLIFRPFARKVKVTKVPAAIEPVDLGDDETPTSGSVKAGKHRRQRPETSRFMTTVALTHLCLTFGQRCTARLQIEGIAGGTFFEICELMKQFSPAQQTQRIYFGRCQIEALDFVYMIKFLAKINSTDGTTRIPAKIKVNKKKLQEEDAMLADIFGQLAKTNEHAWCYCYLTNPLAETTEFGKKVARFEVSELDHLAIVPISNLTHPEHSPTDE